MAVNREWPTAISAAQSRLFGERGLYFVPVRHHSPACALALRYLLQEIQPALILVEGPDDLDHLLPLIQDEHTRAPVAWLCQTTRRVPHADAGEEADDGPDEAAESRSGFFPLCDYSPEWVAIREGGALGARLALIDLPWQQKAWGGDDEDVQDLMHERHFEHSRYLQAMAQRLGCVDHHELWDRLFELRPAAALADWRTFFADVFGWCAMARLDYEPEVLEAELSLPRERHMATHIRSWRDRIEGDIVVLTGGFHTQELVEHWAEAKIAKKPPKEPPPGDAWLIRYSFERLDTLNGYSAGMPSPGYYQQIWEAWQRGDDEPHQGVAVDILTRVARKMRADDQVDAASTAVVQAAVAQAIGLAALRGNAGPGRQDVFDAIRSCFVKGAIDEGNRGFLDDLRQLLTGTRIGDIPPGLGQPPLVEDARRQARAAGLRLDDSQPRNLRLDLYRKPAHQRRSRFLHAMRYLDCDLARYVGGPDFLGNSQLHLMFEEWRGAWSPLVESRLIELSAKGVTVEAVCLAQLDAETEELDTQGGGGGGGQGRSASAAVRLLLRACLIGLQTRLPHLLAMLSAHLDEDASLASVIECGHRLITLWRAREPLGLQGHPAVRELLARIWPAALLLLPDLAGDDEDHESEAIRQLQSLRELGHLLLQSENQVIANADFALFHTHLQDLIKHPGTAPGVCGAAAALLYLGGIWDDATFERQLALRFAPGAQAHHAVRYIGGLMATAPELLMRLPGLLRELDALIGAWGPESFIAFLPDLRQAFTALRPQESDGLAKRILALHGTDPAHAIPLFAQHYDVEESDLHAGMRIQHELEQSLRRDGLEAWL